MPNAGRNRWKSKARAAIEPRSLLADEREKMIERVNRSLERRTGANSRNCADFIHDRQGFAAVEFGMIALPVLLLIFAILEYSYGNFAQSRLDAVVAQASRQIMTGYVQNQTVRGQPLTAQQFRDQIVCPKLPALLSCNDVYVDIESFNAPNNLAVTSPYENYVNATKSGLVAPKLDNSKNAYCIGDAKKYVVIRVAYPAPVLTTAILWPNAVTYKGRKSRLVTSTATFKNEPFPTSNAKC